MKGMDGSLLYAAMDLMGFLGCRHSIFLDLVDLRTPLEKAEDNAQAQLIQERGLAHERAYLHSLREAGRRVVEIAEDAPLRDRVARTLEAMRQGVDVIYQAALWQAPWHGFADFLHRVARPSALGNFSYEAMDTKLSRRPEPRHVLQLCVYSDLLETAQGARPHRMALVLGDGRTLSFRYNDFAYYYTTIKQRFAAYVASPPAISKAEPCPFCRLCKWRQVCQAQWEADDHLSLVADIRRSQITTLEAAGIATVYALAQLDDGVTVSGLLPQTLCRLRAQAQLQVRKRATGGNHLELLPPVEGRGFARLPRPDPGDVFFDMEGDPLYPDGLEYLFGLYYVAGGEPMFTPFWAHDHAAEQQAFEDVIDCLAAHLAQHPHAHIYHYNHYEATALKRLASRYATRESAVDDLLRQYKLVDLYQVVREAIRVSEPSYSLKNLETFYMDKR
jgi:predicted RecB family nuclease